MIKSPPIAQVSQSLPNYTVAPASDPLARWAGAYLGSSDILSWFEPISLSQMDGVSLLDRIDVKYVISVPQFAFALPALAEAYWILDIGGVRLHPYQTLYFDTNDFSLYQSHHAGRQQRYKIRSRTYMDSGLSFLEIKHKGGKRRTTKSRCQTAGLLTGLTPETSDFVRAHAPVDPSLLEPKVWNDFSRITLVSKRQCERLTIDLDVRLRGDDRSVALSGVVIAEVKRESIGPNSCFVQQMREMAIHPRGCSKYCIGVSLLYPQVKHNNFKPMLRLMDRLRGGTEDV